jgi:hypothetical protein
MHNIFPGGSQVPCLPKEPAVSDTLVHQSSLKHLEFKFPESLSHLLFVFCLACIFLISKESLAKVPSHLTDF